MKVAFVHYHLKPGGVTTVIRQQVAALEKIGGESLVLAGAPPPADFPAETVPVAGLGYNLDSAARPSGKTVAEKIAAAIARRWPGGCDLVHVHNPTLAKNIHFPQIIETLQRKGLRLLLQIHDFAEDGRPGAYSQAPYPPDCHYCVINSRDHRILLDAGLKEEGLHLLPNMVSPLGTNSDRKSGAPFVLYPVRAIRRKNIGEALLLTLFFKTGHHIAITLPPNSPVDRVAHEDWKLFSEKHQLPVQFEAGLGGDFQALVDTARSFMTTSITEGFGFSFLESWTAGKALHGRKLPDICVDFETRGIALDDLYSSLMVPMEWFNSDSYLKSWQIAVESACCDFRWKLPQSVMSDAESRLAGCSEIDFGLLNERYQREVIRRLVEDPEKRTVLKQINPFLENLMDRPVSRDRIHRNHNAVMEAYNADSYTKTLERIYRRAANETVRHGIRKDALLSRFFIPDRMSLLKWGPYEQ